MMRASTQANLRAALLRAQSERLIMDFVLRTGGKATLVLADGSRKYTSDGVDTMCAIRAIRARRQGAAT